MQKRKSHVHMLIVLGFLMVIVCGNAIKTSAQIEVDRLEPTGMAKPLADLRDYNGTYDGSVGTGSVGYNGTLYRDNQDDGSRSGCVGEGCGKHPGVDIPAPTGTKVFSATWSQVVISRCDDSWGGLLVLKGKNPWNNSEDVYFTYAHLSERAYSNGAPVLEGHYVSTGVQIGKTGGSPKNKCSGNSSGPHLHFQIDRDDGNAEPWYPAQSQLNMADSNYQVSGKTYNPIVFLTGGYRWTFAHTNDRELWDLFNIQFWGVSNGALWVDAGFDPYIRRGNLTNCGRAKPCSSSIAAEASQYENVFLDLYNQCSTGAGKIYFTTSTDQSWTEQKSVSYAAGFGTVNRHVRMSGNPYWSGIITGLRIDPAENCNPNGFDPTYYGEITVER